MRLLVRLVRRGSGSTRRESIVAAALASAGGERLLDRELPASSLLSALHFRETSRSDGPSANNGNFSGPDVL